MAYSPPLRIPNKLWAAEVGQNARAAGALGVTLWQQNCWAVERWSQQIRCPADAPVYVGNDWSEFSWHMPWRIWTPSTAEDTYNSLERWSRQVCGYLHVPYKRWGFEGKQPELEAANWHAVEDWALGIGDCCRAEGGGEEEESPPTYVYQWYLWQAEFGPDWVDPGDDSMWHVIPIDCDLVGFAFHASGPVYDARPAPMTLQWQYDATGAYGANIGWKPAFLAKMPLDRNFNHVQSTTHPNGSVTWPEPDQITLNVVESGVILHLPAGSRIRFLYEVTPEVAPTIFAFQYTLYFKSAVPQPSAIPFRWFPV